MGGLIYRIGLKRVLLFYVDFVCNESALNVYSYSFVVVVVITVVCTYISCKYV